MIRRAQVLKPLLRSFAPQVPSAESAVEIPEGTPVVFHLYGGNQLFKLQYSRQMPGFNALLQVDENVVVNNKVVIARGSLGEIKVAAPKVGRVSSKEFRGVGISGFSMIPEFVLSAASTRLEFVDESIVVDPQHNNAKLTKSGVVPMQDAQFTAKLKHASIAISR